MNILITGAYAFDEYELSFFKDLDIDIIFLQNENDVLPCEYDWVDGVICNSLFLYHPIEKFKNLKYIQLTSAGFDRTPMEYIQNHNITINNAHGVYSVPMAEFAICGLLQIYKNVNFFTANQNQHIWEKNRNLLELYKKNVCIVGMGSVGIECAKRFKSFDTQIYAVDIYKPKFKCYDKYFPIENIKVALKNSDIVVLTLPLTKATQNMFNKELFNYFKNNSVIINISRGKVVNQNDLILALESKKIYGAVLDVFDEEPLEKTSPLWSMQNVIITPHNSFVGENNFNRMRDLTHKNLLEFIK